MLLCEQKFRDVWSRNESVGAEIGQLLHTHSLTHTHTTAAKLVVRMDSPIAGWSVIDIGASAAQHKEVVKHLPATHALTGCDTVSTIYGIGKVTVLKVLKQRTWPTRR